MKAYSDLDMKGNHIRNCPDLDRVSGITFEDNRSYLEGDIIMHGNKFYRCCQDYTSSGDFDTDLLGGYWYEISIFEEGGEII